MADIALCPHCGKSITVPPDAAPDDRFLCPLCQRGFNAAEAQAVPAAIPVDATKRIKVEYVSDAETRRIAPSSQSLRRRSQPSNWFGQLVGIVGGGVIGLTIGYCILLRLRGPAADFLEIGDRLPRWATGYPADEQPALDDAPPASFNATPAPQPAVDPPAPSAPSEESSTSAPAWSPPPVTEEPQLPADYLGPRHFTPRTSDELGAALAKANDSLGCETCHSTGLVNEVVVTATREVDGKTIETKHIKRVPCTVCGGKAKAKSANEVFDAFRELASAVTFVEVDPADLMLPERRAAAEKLLQRIVGDTELAQNLGRLAGAAWEASAAADQGILLVGTVKETAPEGQLYRTRLVLLGTPREVTILSRRAPTFTVQARAAILGQIIDRPTESLVGYTGNSPRIIWGGLATTRENTPSPH